MRTIALLLLLLGSEFCVALDLPAPGGLHSATEKKSNASQDEGTPQANQPASQRLPAPIEITKAAVIQVETTDKTEKRRDYSSSEWWLVWVTIGVAAITGALALYTAKLWAATKQLVIDADKTAKLQLRPYVSFGIPRISFTHDVSHKDVRDDRFFFDFPVENNGNTPALNCAIEGTTEKFIETPPQLEPIHSPFDPTGGRFDLGPKALGGGGARLTMTVRDIEKIYNREIQFIFVVRCHYTDFLERDQIRRTRMGGIIRVIADPMHAIKQNPVSPVINLESYSQYNHYD